MLWKFVEIHKRMKGCPLQNWNFHTFWSTLLVCILNFLPLGTASLCMTRSGVSMWNVKNTLVTNEVIFQNG